MVSATTGLRAARLELRRLVRALRRLAQNRRAVAGVEFALILPVMVLVYLGGNEVSQALTIQGKVTNVTSTVGDLAAQCKSLNASDISNILTAASSVMSPYAIAPLKIKVSEVMITTTTTTSHGVTTTTISSVVQWGEAFQDTKLNAGATVTTIPAAIVATSTAGTPSYIIVAEAHYAYTPSIGYVMTGTYDLHNTFYFTPRDSPSIDHSSTAASCESSASPS